ncbi:hypothetical protein M0Q28_03285 [Patescibacteria group bacterium]|jgi:hypothetical protein|nr:hypothetical protein [Patescibacteria group bacterium]
MTAKIPKIEGLTEHQVLTLTRARKYNQYLSMIEDYIAGKCAFCDPLGPKNVVIHEIDGWRVWENPFPEANTALQLVLASVRHISTEQLPGVEDILAVAKLFVWAGERYAGQMPGGGLLMRFGSPEYNAGTILHQHAHIMVPNLKGEVRMPLAKEPERVENGIRRLWVFEKLRNGTPMTDLSDEERVHLELPLA